MKKKDFTALKIKDIKALAKLANEKKLEAGKKRLAVFGGKEKNLKAIKNIRRDVAQILSLIREKEIIEKISK